MAVCAAKCDEKSQEESKNLNSDNKEDDEWLLQQYLCRLNYSKAEIEAVLLSKPSYELMSELQYRHGKHIPWENLDQHVHPAGNTAARVEKVWGLTETDGHERIKNPKAIIRKFLTGRGGFCYEVNTAMHWLLSKLGFHARLCVSKVFSDGKLGPPSHCCNMVTIDDAIWLVDPGFGQLLVPVPLNGDIVYDSTGDPLKIQKCNHGSGYDLALYRKRTIAAADCFTGDKLTDKGYTCLHAFRPNDNLSYGNKEFCKGLTLVLTSKHSPFVKGRICSKLTEKGRVTFLKNRIQWTVRQEIVRKNFNDEDEARAALFKHFGIRL